MSWPVRARLTLWYTSVLAATFGAFALVAWFGIRDSLYRTLDDDLAERVAEMARTGDTRDALQMRDDATGAWVYRAPTAARENVALERLPNDGAPRTATIVVDGRPVRSVAASIVVSGRRRTIQIIEPLRDLPAALVRIGGVLGVAFPVVLAVGAAGGFLISRRALAPVDALSAGARAITARDLSQRLVVPESRDELQRLAATLNAMLERLDRTFTRTREFTADASHELRTPVAMMRTVVDVALRRPRTDAEYREALGTIRAELERTSSLIDALLTLARADSAAEDRPSDLVCLDDLVRAACEQARPTAADAGLSLVADTAAWPGARVRASAALLHRLFAILLDNAIKYTRPDGCVTVIVRTDAGHAFVEVRDSGIGIVAEDLPRIFERFYRADPARVRQSGGVGLGLAIARTIVDLHGGTIEVDSQLEGGSTFTVSFPQA